MVAPCLAKTFLTRASPPAPRELFLPGLKERIADALPHRHCREAPKPLSVRFIAAARKGRITDFARRLAEQFELFVPDYLPWGGRFDKAGYVGADFPKSPARSIPRGCAILASSENGTTSWRSSRSESRGPMKRRSFLNTGISRATRFVRLRVAYFDPKLCSSTRGEKNV